MAKVTLTDRFIKSPKRVPVTGRKDHQDALVPGLALRATAAGHKSFVLVARYPLNPKNPTRRALGDHGEITLEEARQKARGWLALIQKGVDPKIEEARQRADARRRQANTFAMVAAEFLDRHAAGLAKAKEARRIVESEFVRRWGARPITDIMPEEAAAAIRAIVKRDAPAQAHNALGYLRRLFTWAIGAHEFGIIASPVERLKPADLIGKRVVRERVLTDEELRKVWDAAAGLGHPSGPIVRMLILTGQREREISDLSWREIDFDRRLITISGRRMKGGRAHEIPLCADALALLEALPHFDGGDYVFSANGGRRPFSGFSKCKRRIDNLSGVTDWRFHDLRRTVRTHLSALPVQDMVRELVIAHARPGLHKVYDQHSYQDEKRECLTLWEARLRGIVAPMQSNVVALRAAANA